MEEVWEIDNPQLTAKQKLKKTLKADGFCKNVLGTFAWPATFRQQVSQSLGSDCVPHPGVFNDNEGQSP